MTNACTFSSAPTCSSVWGKSGFECRWYSERPAGAEHDERPGRVDAEAGEHRRVRLEVREVVLLLQARVLKELRWRRPVAGESLDGDRVGHHNLRCCAAAQLVLKPGPLVVERRRTRDPEPPGRDRQLVRAVRERDVEAASPRPLAQRAEPR